MKKNLLLVSLFAFGATVMFTRCSKDDNDTTNPSITVQGDNPDFGVLKMTYTDPGATASDDKDGDLTADITTSGSVDDNVAGVYTLTYNVSDAAGNGAEKDRDVYIVSMSGTNVASTDDCGTPYVEPSITAIGSSLNFSKFANYSGGAVNATIGGDNESGYTITIPSQSVTCGNPAANRTFSGSGTITFTVNGGVVTRTIAFNYTEITNGNQLDCHGSYTY
jgi:hypothetical protein